MDQIILKFGIVLGKVIGTVCTLTCRELVNNCRLELVSVKRLFKGLFEK